MSDPREFIVGFDIRKERDGAVGTYGSAGHQSANLRLQDLFPSVVLITPIVSLTSLSEFNESDGKKKERVSLIEIIIKYPR